MPSFVTDTNTEPEWQRAKKIVRAEYPEVDEKSDQFWKLVTAIYKSIAHYKPKNENVENALLAAVGNEDFKELTNILSSNLSLSKDGSSYRLYSKRIDGSRRLIFNGSKEELNDFIGAVEIFASSLKEI